MAVYHVNPETGNAGLCKAETGSCPFGADDAHFTSPASARAHFENVVRLEELSSEKLAHGDRILLKSPEGKTLDVVIYDNGYNLLIKTVGANAPTNDARNLVEDHGWQLSKRTPATGEAAMVPGVAEAAARVKLKEARMAYEKAKAAQQKFLTKSRNEPAPLAETTRITEAVFKTLRAVNEANDKLKSIETASIEGKAPKGFSGVQTVPHDFWGAYENNRPIYVLEESSSYIVEHEDTYEWKNKFSGDTAVFRSFGDAVAHARKKKERAKLADQ